MSRARARAPGVAKVFKLSSNETPLGPGAKRDRGLSRGRRAPGGLSGRLGAGLRQAIGDIFGLDPARIVCGAGSDDLLNLLAAPICRRRRGDPHHARLSGLPDRHAGHRRQTGGRAGERISPPTSTPSSTRDAAHQSRIPRQSEQSDRDLYAVRRDQAAARGLPARRAAGARRGLCRVRAAQRLRSPASSWSPRSENVVMTRTFSKIYGLAALRLGWMYGPAPYRRRDQPHPRAVQRQRAGDGGRHRGDRATARMSSMRARTMSSGSPGSARKSANSGCR